MKRLFLILAAVVLVLTACDTTDMVLSPPDGQIVAGPTVPVSGKLPSGAKPGGTLKVNGATVPVAGDGTWSTTVAATSGYTTSIDALYTDPGGVQWRQRKAVINGPSVPDGAYSPEGVGLRFTNTGLANLGPVINQLAGGAFDIGSILLAQRPLFNVPDAFLTFDIKGNAYEAGIGSASVVAGSGDNGVSTTITVKDLYIGVDLNITDNLAINTNCRLELQIPTTVITNTFDFRPLPGNPSKVDVNLVGTPSVDTGTVGYEFISGICDADTFLIGDIVNALAGGQIQSLVAGGFSSQLGDPDGSGPLDSPVAAAIQAALGDISIAGSVGTAVKVNLDAPFTQITESSTAIDFRADADFFPTIGSGPSDCPAVANAPDLTSAFDVPGTYPTLGATTPSGDPYGLGLVVSSSAFNQMLSSMTECGLLNQDVTEISLGGPPVPITSTVLSLLAPQFGTKLPPGTPIKIRVVPTTGPYLTDRAGPNGEPGELVLGNLLLQFIQTTDGNESVVLELAVDAPLGFDLGVNPALDQLAPTISPPPSSAVKARVYRNTIGVSEPAMEALFPSLFPSFVSGLSDTFAAFPLPDFLGLKLNVKSVNRQGNYWVLYSNLDQVPQTRLANVSVTDLSTADSVVDSAFDVNQWRHRIRSTVTPTQVKVDFNGMIGADACCTVDDESRSATAAYRVSMNAIPENGETWKLDLSQVIKGAHTLIDEKVALEDAGGETRFQTAVTGRVRVGTGPWQDFSFTPNPSSVVHRLGGGEGTTNREFTGSGATSVQGSTTQAITVEFSVGLYVKSDSNAFFPAAGGDEVAIRFGANDTIANGFTAGEYPGLGNRSIADDGWKSTITLTALP
ncbi:MAG: hypothetical protein KF703_04335 [Actinobacteria bacterium]|nr:hypothetical protein [Actinomycetota bacterium]